MSLLEIEGLTHSFGENLLYKNAGFTLNKGEHIGIVGQNGTGKSTLIKICTEQIIPDNGRIIWQPNITIGYLDQYAEIDHALTMKEFLKSAFAKLFEIEAQAMQLYEKAADGDMKSLELAAYYQEQLETHDFYSIDTAIERVANGLGLLAIGLDRPIIEMSGGQRAKVILAKLLLEKPDVLLLDEPTNFLDKDHVAWLAEYLSSLENAFLVVSHDFEFLDKIANRICNGIFNHTSLCQFYQGRLLLQVTIPFEEKPTSNLPGDNLRYYRQRKSLTTRQLAEQIDVVPATILMYEQNKHPIPFDVANSLADALDVNADLLYDDFAVFLVTPYSEALKNIRMSIGMSQRAFAEHIGVIPSYYYKLESGHRRPSRKVYQRMVDTLSHTHPHHSLFAQHKLQSK